MIIVGRQWHTFFRRRAILRGRILAAAAWIFSLGLIVAEATANEFPKEGNLFTNAPCCVALPEVGKAKGGKRLMAIYVPAGEELQLTLVTPGPTGAELRVAEGKHKERQWEVRLFEEDTSAASIALNENHLLFNWKKDAPAKAAEILADCLLEIKVGDSIHTLQLQEPISCPAFSFHIPTEKSEPEKGIRVTSRMATQVRGINLLHAPHPRNTSYQIELSRPNQKPFVSCKFPTEAMALGMPLKWSCDNDGLAEIKCDWRVTAEGNQLEVKQNQQYKVRRGWKPLTIHQLNKHWDALNDDFYAKKGCYVDWEVKLELVKSLWLQLNKIGKQNPGSKKYQLAKLLTNRYHSAVTRHRHALQRLMNHFDDARQFQDVVLAFQQARSQSVGFRLTSTVAGNRIVLVRAENSGPRGEELAQLARETQRYQQRFVEKNGEYKEAKAKVESKLKGYSKYFGSWYH